MILFLFASFGLGFALCLILLGRSENELHKQINVLKKENQEMKVKYLSSCWNTGTPGNN